MIPTDQPMFMANRVLDNVFVGGHFAAEDEDFIFTNTITRVINTVAHQVPCRFQSMNVKYLQFQFDQNGTSNIFDQKDERITQVVRFINEAVEQDSNVLVHSQNGDSRSVVVMAAYLIHRFHWPPHRALQFIATKRFNSRPHTNYVKQLHEFANRRRNKYGEFKDIFGNVKNLKLNFQEILHRNTFLNAVMQQDPAVIGLTQPSPVEALVSNNMARPRPVQKTVTFRDGLQTAQIPSQYANFDQNGNFMNPQLSSPLFRPKTPSYSSPKQIRCLPIRLDALLLPSVSFDLDINEAHVRRNDGYLQSTQAELSSYAVCARPVSILKVHLESDKEKYDNNSVIVPVGEFETMLRNIDKFTFKQQQQNIQTQQHPAVENIDEQTEQKINQTTIGNLNMSMNKAGMQRPQPGRQNPLVVTNKPLITQLNNAGVQQKQSNTYNQQINQNQTQIPASQMLGTKPGSFSRIRPPTPPRKTDLVVQATTSHPVTSTQTQLMRPIQQQIYSFNNTERGQQQVFSTSQTLNQSQRPTSQKQQPLQNTANGINASRPGSTKPQQQNQYSYLPKWK